MRDSIIKYQRSKKVNIESIELEGIPIEDFTKKAKKE